MRYFVNLAVICSIVWPLFLTGCKKQPASPTPAGQETPEALIRKHILAICQRDKEKYMQGYLPVKYAQDFAALDYELVTLHNTLYLSLKEEYGEDAWERWSEIGGWAFSSWLAEIEIDQIDAFVSSMDITIKGTNADLRIPGIPRFSSSVKKVDGGWFFSETEEEMEQARDFFESLVKAYTEVLQYLDKPGVTLEELKQKMLDKLDEE